MRGDGLLGSQACMYVAAGNCVPVPCTVAQQIEQIETIVKKGELSGTK